MRYYAIGTNWDKDGNSPWDLVWDDLPQDALDCLDGSLPLAAIWNPPHVTLEKRETQPNVYGFVLHFAVTEVIHKLLAPIVQDEAEFLPLHVPEIGTLFIIHPLWPVDFDENAEVQCGEISGNITVVKKYSFTLDPDKYDGPRHLFRMRQAKGSAARDAGYTLSTLIVSEKIKVAATKAGVTGIVFKYVHSA